MKYPKQIAVIRRPKKTLGIDSFLAYPAGNDEAPLAHAGYSRFEVNLIDKHDDGGTFVGVANIPVNDVHIIKYRTKAAINLLYTPSVTKDNAKSSSSKSSLAFTQTLADRNFKGKTPGDILSSDPSQKDALMKVREWLAANVGKYPNNQKQIDAIDEAVALLDMGSLAVENSVASSTVFSVYKSDFKFKKKKDEKGNNLIYGIEISMDSSKTYPFSVQITNYYAPVETLKDGQVRIGKRVGDLKVCSISLSDAEWVAVAETMCNRLRDFDICSAREQIKKSEEALTANIEKAKE